MRLIIHADDFGINESVSCCIAECFRRHWVTETSVMVNMPFADAAIALARTEGFAARVGIHINLSEGYPLTESIKRFPRFCNQDGSFNKKFHHRVWSRFVLSSGENDAVRDEISAQLDRFCSYGGLLMKIDSHHHVHTDLSVYRILKPLALQRGFQSMRLSATAHEVGFGKTIYKCFFNSDVKRSFSTTDEFDGFSLRLLERTKAGSCAELMTHPMYSSLGEILDTNRSYAELMETVHAKLSN